MRLHYTAQFTEKINKDIVLDSFYILKDGDIYEVDINSVAENFSATDYEVDGFVSGEAYVINTTASSLRINTTAPSLRFRFSDDMCKTLFAGAKLHSVNFYDINNDCLIYKPSKISITISCDGELFNF